MGQVFLFSVISAYKFIFLWAQNVTRISPLWALLYIFAVITIFFLFFAAFKIVLKDKEKSIIASLIIVCFLSLNITGLKLFYIIFALFCIFGFFVINYLDTKKVLAFLKPFGITLLALSFLNGASIFIRDRFDMPAFIPSALAGKKQENLKTPSRDIYIIVLDAHAGNRTLKYLGGNNDYFIKKLEEKGFIVFKDMESNYRLTLASLPSFLNAEYTENIPYDSPSKAINNARLFSLAKNAGYKIYYLNSWPTDLYIKKGLIDEIHTLGEDDFQKAAELFIGNTALYYSIDFNMEGRAKEMQEAFNYADNIFSKGGYKHLFFAHFFMPHRPYIFNKDGKVNTDFAKTNDEETDDALILNKQPYLDYLKFADDKTLEFVDKIFARKGEKPIIIIMGDHGARPVDYRQNEPRYKKEVEKYGKYYFNTFIAYYNPETKPENYANVKSHINFAINFQNEVFGAGLKNVEDRHIIWWTYDLFHKKNSPVGSKSLIGREG